MLDKQMRKAKYMILPRFNAIFPYILLDSDR